MFILGELWLYPLLLSSVFVPTSVLIHVSVADNKGVPRAPISQGITLLDNSPEFPPNWIRHNRSQPLLFHAAIEPRRMFLNTVKTERVRVISLEFGEKSKKIGGVGDLQDFHFQEVSQPLLFHAAIEPRRIFTIQLKRLLSTKMFQA